MRGLCPTSPNKQGGYAVAGLAYKSRTTDLRSDRKNDPVTGEGQTINTYAIAMAKNLPDFVLPLGNGALTLVPIAYAGPTSSTPEIDSAEWKSSSLAQLTIEEQIFDADGDLRYIRFLALWEDSAWGNDYDMDMVSRISMCVADECTNHDDDGDGVNDLNPGADTARVTIRFMHAEGGVSMKIGFVTSGTTADGEYAEVRKAAGGAANFSSFDDDPLRDVEEPTPVSYTFVAGSSPADNLPLPLELAAKYGSFNDSDGDGLPDIKSEWDGNNDDMADSFFFADDPSQIGPKLAAYLAETADSSSSASVVANSVSLQTTTRIYQAQFDSAVWSGSVVSYPVDVATGALLPAEWNASIETAKLDWDSEREWLTWAGTDADNDGFPDDADADGVPDGGGVPFRWGSLDDIQKAFLNTPPGDVPPATDDFGDDRVEYLRGNKYYEVTQGNVVGDSPSFRDRLTLSGNAYGLGDVVHSTPTVVGVPNFGYSDGLEPSAPYSSFKAQYANVDCADATRDREPILYFGGNDGALHGVSACDGAERVAYVPRAVYPWLNELTSVDYAHRFYVDGAPTVVDAYFGSDNSWHTVLVGTLAAGGAGVFALDVTDPSKFDESYADDVVLWDIVATPPPSDPDEPDSDFQELGFTFSQPAVVKAEGHGWVAVFGNGYHGGPTNPYPGANSKAVLYFVDIETGKLLQKIDFSTVSAGDQTHNGLSTVAPVDRDGDGDVDLIYAGDLKGNVWRVAATIPAGPPTFVQGTGFQTASVSRLYKAKSKDGVDQPITSRMSVGYHPTSAVGRMVYFGTGKYYEDADQDPLNAVQYNTMYGIWDRDDPNLSPGSVTTRNSDILQQQTIEVETSSSFGLNLFDVRTVSNTPVTWALPNEGCDTDKSCGWYLDLTDVGEKMVSTPILRGGRLIFVTTIPSQETCGAGGTGWLMELCAANGGRCDYPVFDLNGDGLFDLQDNLAQTDGDVTTYTPVSGKKSKVGILQPPAILAGIGGSGDGSYGGVEGKYASGSNQARIDVTIENPGLLGAGRKSWVRIK
jgi:type IV pilus assembly protein PilY1